jgi:hypothetical protein
MNMYVYGKLKKDLKMIEMINIFVQKYEQHILHKSISIKFIDIFDTVQSISLPKLYIFNYNVH